MLEGILTKCLPLAFSKSLHPITMSVPCALKGCVLSNASMPATCSSNVACMATLTLQVQLWPTFSIHKTATKLEKLTLRHSGGMPLPRLPALQVSEMYHKLHPQKLLHSSLCNLSSHLGKLCLKLDLALQHRRQKDPTRSALRKHSANMAAKRPPPHSC